jgi:hypothetical protein
MGRQGQPSIQRHQLDEYFEEAVARYNVRFEPPGYEMRMVDELPFKEIPLRFTFATNRRNERVDVRDGDAILFLREFVQECLDESTPENNVFFKCLDPFDGCYLE